MDDDLDYLWGKREALIYRVQLSTRYHQKRERFYDLLDKLAKAIAIFGGSAALSKSLSVDTLVVVASAITATSTLSLVFAFSDKAKRHSEMSRNFCQLEAEIAGKGERDFAEADVAGWDAKVRSLEASEPPALGALVVACQNELAAAAGQAHKVVAIPFLKRLTRHLVDWHIQPPKPAN